MVSTGVRDIEENTNRSFAFLFFLVLLLWLGDVLSIYESNSS